MDAERYPASRSSETPAARPLPPHPGDASSAGASQPPTAVAPDPPAPTSGQVPIPDEADVTAKFWERIRVFAARHLGDAAAAEDVAQETLRRVVDALRQGRVENLTALPAFVFQTARHICLQQRRSLGREARALHRLGRDDPERVASTDALAALVTEERRQTVRRALAQLDRDDRALLHLVYYEQSETDEIARRLALTPGAVRVRKHRALRRLSELLRQPSTGNDLVSMGT